MKTILRFVVGLLLLGAGYYFGVWGYFGLFFGEANYTEIPRYRIMLVAGGIAFVVGLYLAFGVVLRVLGRRRERKESKVARSRR